MTLKAAILTALPPESIVVLALAAWPRITTEEIESIDDPAELVRSYRERLRRSRRITLDTTLLALNKDSLVTICRVLGIDHRGRRAELTSRLLEFDAGSRRQRTRADASAKSRVSTAQAAAAPVAAAPVATESAKTSSAKTSSMKTSVPKKASASASDSRVKPRSSKRSESRPSQ